MKVTIYLLALLGLAGCATDFGHVDFNPTEVYSGEGQKNQMEMTNYLFTQANICWSRNPTFTSHGIEIRREDNLHHAKVFGMTLISAYQSRRFTGPFMQIYVSDMPESSSYVSVRTDSNAFPWASELWRDVEAWVNGDTSCKETL